MPAPRAPRFAHQRLATIAAAVLCAHALVLLALPAFGPTPASPAAPLSVVVLPRPEAPGVRTAPAQAGTAAQHTAVPRASPARSAATPMDASAPPTPAVAATPPPPAAPQATVFAAPPAAAVAPGVPALAAAAGTPAPAAPLAAAGGAGGATASAIANGTSGAGRNENRSEGPSLDAQYLHTPPLDYPRISRQRGEQGRVLVQVLVGADGLPQKTALQASSGFARLDQAALESVMRWRFVPGRRDGVAQTMWYTVPVQFVLQ